MAGTVTSYDPVTGALVASIVSKEGTATYAAWNIFRAPTPGTSMIQVGTSVTSLAIGTGAKSLTIDIGLDLAAGELIYIIYATAAGMNATGMILTLAANQLQDETGQNWDVSVLVPYLNLFFLELTNLKPEAFADVQNITLVAGPVQTIPATAIALIDVICNMGTSGTTRGQEIKSVPKESMDDLVPGWMSFTADQTVLYVIIDPRTPKKFYVFPPQTGTPVKVEAVLTMPPTPITSPDGTFPLDDSYVPAAVDYVIYRALSEETTIPNAQAKAVLYYNKFMQDLGLKTNVETKNEQKGK